MRHSIPTVILAAAGLIGASPFAEHVSGPGLIVRDFKPDFSSIPDAWTLPEDAWSNSTEGAYIYNPDTAKLAAAVGHGILHNKIDQSFEYVLIGRPTDGNNGVFASGMLNPGQSVDFPYNPPSEPGYSLKLAYRDAAGSPNPEQMEFARDNNQKVFYDFSAIDGDPFVQYQRSIIPSQSDQPGFNCGPIVCEPGQEDCAYQAGGSGDPNRSCPESVDLNVNIG